MDVDEKKKEDEPLIVDSKSEKSNSVTNRNIIEVEDL
jgi:hypothetical protein